MLFAMAGLASLAGFAQEPPRTPAAPSRQASERVIREVLYETAVSAFTGDVKLYRRHIARRTMKLYVLVFEGLREIPDEREVLTENKLDTADKFLDSVFVRGASQWDKLSRDEIEQKAHAQANGTLIFLNDQEAILRFGGSTIRVVYEDKEWKVDETESAKELFLKNFAFTAETRAKIDKL